MYFDAGAKWLFVFIKYNKMLVLLGGEVISQLRCSKFCMEADPVSHVHSLVENHKNTKARVLVENDPKTKKLKIG